MRRPPAGHSALRRSAAVTYNLEEVRDCAWISGARPHAEAIIVGGELALVDRIEDSELRWLHENALASAFRYRGEGSRLSLAEASGFGSPLVACSISAVREVMRDGIVYSGVDSAAAVGAAMDRVIDYFWPSSKHTNFAVSIAEQHIGGAASLDTEVYQQLRGRRDA